MSMSAIEPIDYYLSVNSEADMPVIPKGASLSVIGVWSERTGGTDEEPEYTALPGYHFNVRSSEPIEWPASVTVSAPVTPWRVFG